MVGKSTVRMNMRGIRETRTSLIGDRFDPEVERTPSMSAASPSSENEEKDSVELLFPGEESDPSLIMYTDSSENVPVAMEMHEKARS
mmetsp:Transcript_20956/g.49213  ORF Transcript_20956/g.49213 Transcript_20956/m.49213 type:complete len:87 (+) Transcript_20956:985-1245(+)